MKTFFYIISLIISFAICFNVPYLLTSQEVALNWNFFGLLIVLLLSLKLGLRSSIEKCKLNLKSMQAKKAYHWSDVFGLNVKEWSSVFVAITPLSIILLAISKCITHLIPLAGFLNYVVLVLPSLLAMGIYFMVLCVAYHKRINKKNVSAH